MEERRCDKCRARLSQYNPGPLCSPCQEEAANSTVDALPESATVGMRQGRDKTRGAVAPKGRRVVPESDTKGRKGRKSRRGPQLRYQPRVGADLILKLLSVYNRYLASGEGMARALTLWGTFWKFEDVIEKARPAYENQKIGDSPEEEFWQWWRSGGNVGADPERHAAYWGEVDALTEGLRLRASWGPAFVNAALLQYQPLFTERRPEDWQRGLDELRQAVRGRLDHHSRLIRPFDLELWKVRLPLLTWWFPTLGWRYDTMGMAITSGYSLDRPTRLLHLRPLWQRLGAGWLRAVLGEEQFEKWLGDRLPEHNGWRVAWEDTPPLERLPTSVQVDAEKVLIAIRYDPTGESREDFLKRFHEEGRKQAEEVEAAYQDSRWEGWRASPIKSSEGGKKVVAQDMHVYWLFLRLLGWSWRAIAREALGDEDLANTVKNSVLPLAKALELKLPEGRGGRPRKPPN